MGRESRREGQRRVGCGVVGLEHRLEGGISISRVKGEVGGGGRKLGRWFWKWVCRVFGEFISSLGMGG